jgi:hypothetical protein
MEALRDAYVDVVARKPPEGSDIDIDIDLDE